MDKSSVTTLLEQQTCNKKKNDFEKLDSLRVKVLYNSIRSWKSDVDLPCLSPYFFFFFIKAPDSRNIETRFFPPLVPGVRLHSATSKWQSCHETACFSLNCRFLADWQWGSCSSSKCTLIACKHAPISCLYFLIYFFNLQLVIRCIGKLYREV